MDIRSKARGVLVRGGLLLAALAAFAILINLSWFDEPFYPELERLRVPEPVSMENIKEARKICDKYGKQMYVDGARFAENAYFIKTREPKYADWPIERIAKHLAAQSVSWSEVPS